MKEQYFSTFKEAQSFAQNIAEFFQIGSFLKKSGEVFTVSTKEKAHPDKLRKFAGSVYFDRMSPAQIKSHLDYAASSDLRSESLVWLDPETKLIWDSSRLLCDKEYTLFPGNESKIIMNALHYAGLANWRIPTLNELKTLSVEKIKHAGVDFKTSPGGEISFWSSDPVYSGPEMAFLDLASMRVGYQRFREQHKDRNKSGDGYTESGQTILVSSDCTTLTDRSSTVQSPEINRCETSLASITK